MWDWSCVSSMSDVRVALCQALDEERFVIDKSGVKTVEIIGASFLAEESAIFGQPNDDYIKRELAWYESQSLNVNDIPGGPPEIWKRVATPEGRINSNYGWMIWNPSNCFQYENVLAELKKNPFSRRAVMIYQRPEMWYDFDDGGMSDFVCTNAVQYLIRDGELHAVVQMRSNDAIFGYKNDWAWQKHVLEKLAVDLGVPPGQIIWNAGSLHVYERHFYLLDWYWNEGETSVTPAHYSFVYPNSQWV
jgi:thymidylate synthase